MIDFNKSPILGIVTYGILLISCILEISVELGLHEFEAFASHHGLAIFAVGSLFANWDDLTKSIKKLISKSSCSISNYLAMAPGAHNDRAKWWRWRESNPRISD